MASPNPNFFQGNVSVRSSPSRCVQQYLRSEVQCAGAQALEMEESRLCDMMDPHNVYLVILSLLVWNFFCIFFPSFSFSLPSAMRQCRCVQSEVQSCPERTLELRHYVRRHFLAFVAL